MGTLTDWFRTRRESGIIKMIKEHAKKAYNCVVQFKDAIILFFEGNMAEAQNSIKKVSQIEHECDNIRREVLKALTKGELAPEIRNDMAHLINRLDNVANSANAAARHLAILYPDPIRDIYEILLEMVDKSILCAEVLRDTIEIEIERSTEDIDASITKINRIEHEVDEIHYKILDKLNHLETKDLSVFVALNIYELIESTEGISDACEHTAEYVKLINIRAASKS